MANATDEYFSEQDSVSTFFAERCERVANAKTPSRALFSDWTKWTAARGEDAGTEKRFSEALQKYAAKKREAAGVMFLGIKLLPSESGVW